MGFTIHIRSVGLLLVLIFIIYRFFIENNIRTFSFRKQSISFITILSVAIIYFPIKFYFPCNANYPSFLATENFWETFNDHLSYNIHHLSWLFRGYETKNYFSIGVLASCGLLIFSILGYFHYFKSNKKSLLILYVPAYVIMVLSYKFSHAGLRFLYPVLFFIFLFAIIGLKKSIEPFQINNRIFAIISAVLILFSYRDETLKLINNKDAIIKDIDDNKCFVQALDSIHYRLYRIKR